MSNTIDILGLTSDALADAARFALGKGHGIATQLYPQVMNAGRFALEDFAISAESTTAWRKHFSVNLLEIASVVEEPGEFGTTAKAILKTHDGYEVECVRIPMRSARPGSGVRSPESTVEDHETPDPGPRTPDGGFDYTLCLSSQVGCKMGCTFCETGRMGLIRHLTAAEIVSEVVTVRAKLGWPVRNLVFMGMGEALDNVDNVIQALKVLTDKRGLHYSQERITICTSGHAEGLAKLAALNWKRLN